VLLNVKRSFAVLLNIFIEEDYLLLTLLRDGNYQIKITTLNRNKITLDAKGFINTQERPSMTIGLDEKKNR